MYMNLFGFTFINMAINRGCKKNPNVFCHTCGEFTVVSNIKKIDNLMTTCIMLFLE